MRNTMEYVLPEIKKYPPLPCQEVLERAQELERGGKSIMHLGTGEPEG